ncbi:MAG: ABC transporter ATP-binding protein [Deltaproteobacteria bacterium]|nr:ABC transporter ATP-binding protein [Deltaproteobacteria bacterium]
MPPETSIEPSVEPILELRQVHKSFGAQAVLRGLDLTVERGRVNVIIGRSGGGKSVILKHMIGLLQPDRGRILVDGVDLAGLGERGLNDIRKRFGMLFQEAALFDSMSVFDNVAFPLREHTRLAAEKIRQVVAEKLALVGLPGAEGKMPSQLSGGMKKRVGLARAIALEPEIILYDEPTTGLDPLMTEAINRLIADTGRRLGATSVIISHDLKGAFGIGEKISMLYDGVIIASGGPADIQASPDPVVQQFIQGRVDGPIEVI